MTHAHVSRFRDGRINTVMVMHDALPDGQYLIRARDFFTPPDGNRKIHKNKILSAGFSMHPARIAGHALGNVCPSASAGCIFGCINTSGNAGVFPRIILARIAKRVLFHQHRDIFAELWHQCMRVCIDAGVKAFRPNVFSDIHWPMIKGDYISRHPEIQFYGYTKVYRYMREFLDGKLPSNYYLTFSRSETNESECVDILDRGGNVTIPFQVPYSRHGMGPLPTHHEMLGRKFKVKDGDMSDERWLDGRGEIIGLHAKGRMRKIGNDKHGFIVTPMKQYMSWSERVNDRDYERIS